jgi:hypothetical protein
LQNFFEKLFWLNPSTFRKSRAKFLMQTFSKGGFGSTFSKGGFGSTFSKG